MLPLGQKVQEKLERLIDKYMLQLGKNRLALLPVPFPCTYMKRCLQGVLIIHLISGTVATNESIRRIWPRGKLRTDASVDRFIPLT